VEVVEGEADDRAGGGGDDVVARDAVGVLVRVARRAERALRFLVDASASCALVAKKNIGNLVTSLRIFFYKYIKEKTFND
jgi:hypothetical protein